MLSLKILCIGDGIYVYLVIVFCVLYFSQLLALVYRVGNSHPDYVYLLDIF